MSLTKSDQSTKETLNLNIDKGDLKALKEIIKVWSFKDVESALRFAIAVLIATKPGELYRKETIRCPLLPTDQLLFDKNNLFC